MSNYNKIVTTLAGSNMLVESINQKKPLIFTRVALGDGTLLENESIELLTDLKHKICENGVESIHKKGNGEIDVVATISNSNVITGFYARELGVFAKVGEDGIEKLFAYTNAGAQASYTVAGTSLDEKLITITFYVGNAENVTINLNSQMYITKDMLDSLKGAVEGKVDTYKADTDNKIAASKSTIEGLLNAHKADITAHGLDRYAGGTAIPSNIRNWNDLTKPGIYECNASVLGWANAPSSSKIYPYGQIVVEKTEGNVITQTFYSYGQGKAIKQATRVFYNAWSGWQYHADWDNVITGIAKHNEGLNVTKGDATELIKLITNSKTETNTALAPTLAVVKALIGDVNIDVTSILKSQGVRYDFSNENAWYICLGSSFGGLIVQGGKFIPETANITYSIRFTKVLAVLPMMLDEPTAWHEMMVRPKSITTSNFKIVSGSNNTNYPKSRNNGCWIAFGI